MTSRQNKHMFNSKNTYQNEKTESTNFPPIHVSKTSTRLKPENDKALRVSMDSNPYITPQNPAKNEQAGPISVYYMRSSGFDSVRKELKKQPTETGNQHESSQKNLKLNSNKKIETTKIRKK